jgi:predicted transcriptional regulator
MTRLESEILLAMIEYRRPVSWKDLAIRVSGTRKEILYTLHALVEQNWITRTDVNDVRLYTVNESTPSTEVIKGATP